MKTNTLLLSVLAGSLIGSPSLAQDKPPKKQTFEVVDGKRYRIVLRGDTGYVVNKSAFVMMSPDEVQRRKKAVEKTSGCKVSDAQILGLSVFVQLDCSAKIAEPVTAPTE